MKPTKEQEKLIVEAGQKIREAFPDRNMKFTFNLSSKHSNVNYNMEGDWKISGILNPKIIPSIKEQ